MSEVHPAHYRVDLPQLELSDTLTLYRISRTKFADLSGMGAFQYPGRWNNKAQRAVYTSTEVGTAALEVLSYLDRDTPPLKKYSIMAISLYIKQCAQYQASSSRTVIREAEPGGPGLVFFRSLEVASQFVNEPMSPVGVRRNPRWLLGMIAPSLLVPAYNAVLYPDNPFFSPVVKLVAVEPFNFHPYLFGHRNR